MALDGFPAGFELNPGQQRVFGGLYQSPSRFALVYGGSRSGKTFLTILAIVIRALKAPFSKHLIVRQEAAAARSALARGNNATIRAVMRLCFPGLGAVWNEKYGYYEFENGSEIWIGGLNDDKAMERVLGNEYASIYMNEASEIRHSAFVLLRSRLAQVCTDIDGNEVRQRFYVDLNPTTRMHWTYRIWIDGVDPEDGKPVNRSMYGAETISPYENRLNLTAAYIADLEAYGQRARKRFLDGEFSADDDNALWQRGYIKRVALREDGKMPVELQRIVVAIDPAVSTTPGADETGIVAMGVGADGFGYVLADESGKYRPEEWARRAVSLYRSLGADLVIGEVNHGGDLIESTLRTQAPDVAYRAVRATRGKAMRAEPVAALYERGKVFHVGEFPDLEDQMTAVTIDFDRKAQGWSPDRVDALVWAATELFPALAARPTSTGPLPGVKFSMV